MVSVGYRVWVCMLCIYEYANNVTSHGQTHYNHNTKAVFESTIFVLQNVVVVVVRLRLLFYLLDIRWGESTAFTLPPTRSSSAAKDVRPATAEGITYKINPNGKVRLKVILCRIPSFRHGQHFDQCAMWGYISSIVYYTIYTLRYLWKEPNIFCKRIKKIIVVLIPIDFVSSYDVWAD